MYTIDKERVVRVLESENLRPDQIQYLLNNYPPLDDKLGPIFEKWLTTHEVCNVEADGIFLLDVIEKRSCHFLTAIRDLNKLLDSSLSDDERQQWHKILSTQVFFR